MKSILFSDTYHPTPKGHPSFLKEGKLSSGIHWDDRQILAEQLCIYSAVIGTYRYLSELISTYRNLSELIGTLPFGRIVSLLCKQEECLFICLTKFYYLWQQH